MDTIENKKCGCYNYINEGYDVVREYKCNKHREEKLKEEIKKAREKEKKIKELIKSQEKAFYEIGKELFNLKKITQIQIKEKGKRDYKQFYFFLPWISQKSVKYFFQNRQVYINLNDEKPVFKILDDDIEEKIVDSNNYNLEVYNFLYASSRLELAKNLIKHNMI